MIILAFIACLGSQCSKQQLTYLPDIGIMGCMTTAQARLAEWTSAHPKYTITHWSCGYKNPKEREI